MPKKRYEIGIHHLTVKNRELTVKNQELLKELAVYKKALELACEAGYVVIKCPSDQAWDNCKYDNSDSCYSDFYFTTCLMNNFTLKAEESLSKEEG
jgi:hypothetical protein